MHHVAMGYEETSRTAKKPERPLPPAREADVAFYLSCQRDVPNPDHCQWAARVPPAGVSSCIVSHSRASNAHCATTLGGIMKLPRRQFLHLAAGAAALPALPRVARAQAFPARPITIIVPFPAGGGGGPLRTRICRPLIRASGPTGCRRECPWHRRDVRSREGG